LKVMSTSKAMQKPPTFVLAYSSGLLKKAEEVARLARRSPIISW
jgi:hypothetical protein